MALVRKEDRDRERREVKKRKNPSESPLHRIAVGFLTGQLRRGRPHGLEFMALVMATAAPKSLFM
jgi:hypothetical protein